MKNIFQKILIFYICTTSMVSPNVSAADILSHAVLNLPYELRSVEPWLRIINTQEEWESLYNEILVDNVLFPSEEPPATEFDFDAYQLIAGGIGMKTSGAHRIAVERVYVFSNEIFITLFHVIATAPGCSSAAVINYPSTAILIQKTDKPIRISITEAINDCT